VVLVLFYDGDCGFCSRSVRLVYGLDPGGAIEFAPLQGVLAGKLNLQSYADKKGGSMVVLRESDGAMFIKSEAWILLGETLGGVWAVLAFVFSLFPKTARDWGYDLVAKNRYRLAGKANRCALPDEGFRKRMRE
jgi:predicted DCC family thiol-disulfide oxidoreductase YuxK